MRANVTIAKVVLNKLANELYSQFEKLSDKQQKNDIFRGFSD